MHMLHMHIIIAIIIATENVITVFLPSSSIPLRMK